MVLTQEDFNKKLNWFFGVPYLMIEKVLCGTLENSSLAYWQSESEVIIKISHKAASSNYIRYMEFNTVAGGFTNIQVTCTETPLLRDRINLWSTLVC